MPKYLARTELVQLNWDRNHFAASISSSFPTARTFLLRCAERACQMSLRKKNSVQTRQWIPCGIRQLPESMAVRGFNRLELATRIQESHGHGQLGGSTSHAFRALLLGANQAWPLTFVDMAWTLESVSPLSSGSPGVSRLTCPRTNHPKILEELTNKGSKGCNGWKNMEKWNLHAGRCTLLRGIQAINLDLGQKILGFLFAEHSKDTKVGWFKYVSMGPTIIQFIPQFQPWENNDLGLPACWETPFSGCVFLNGVFLPKGHFRHAHMMRATPDDTCWLIMVDMFSYCELPQSQKNWLVWVPSS